MVLKIITIIILIKLMLVRINRKKDKLEVRKLITRKLLKHMMKKSKRKLVVKDQMNQGVKMFHQMRKMMEMVRNRTLLTIKRIKIQIMLRKKLITVEMRIIIRKLEKLKTMELVVMNRIVVLDQMKI